MDLCNQRWHNIYMKTKISYIVISALAFSLISGVSPAIAKPAPSQPAPKVAYSSPAPAPKAAAPAPAPAPKAAAPAPAPKAAAPAPAPAPKAAAPAAAPKAAAPVAAAPKAAAPVAAAPKAAAPVAAAPKAVSTFSYSPPVVPPKQNIVIPSALAANKSPVSTAASKSVSTSSYQTGANNTTAAAEKPKVATFTPTSTLPRITAPVMAYDFSTQTINKTEISKSESANGSTTTVAKDIINSKLVIKETVTPSKAGMASTLSNITKATGLETVSLVGGKVTTIKPGDVIAINKSTNTQYNSTAKLNTTASQKEILKNVEAVKNAGLNTVLIQAYSDSTGKSDYNLGLSQARANEDLKNYALTMEKNGYSSKDGQWKDATGKVVPASKCTSFCSFTKTGETVPSIQLAAQGKGEVTPNTAGALGANQAKIVAAGCSNSRAGACAALHDAQRVSLIGGVLDKSLIKTSSSSVNDIPPVGDTCQALGGCIDRTPQCLNPLGCNNSTPTTTSVGSAQLGSPASGTTSVVPAPGATSVTPGSTTTSRLPSSGVVTGGSSVGSGTPSAPGSTSGSTPTTSTSGTPSSGVSGTPSGAGSSSTGSTLLPPAAGLGGSTSGGTLGGTPSAPSGGSASTATPAPKFKVS